jgi:hypothetical protein
MIECVSKSLFYKLLFYYFRKNRVQTLLLLLYASKANRLIWDLLLKPLFWFWKHVWCWFKTLLWILQNLWKWFELIWSMFAKVTKEIRKQKRKRRNEIKIWKWTRDNVSAQKRKQPAACLALPESVPFSFSHLADSRGPRVSTDAFFLLQLKSRPSHRYLSPLQFELLLDRFFPAPRL